MQSAAEISGLWWRTASSMRQRRNAGPRSMLAPSHSTVVEPFTDCATSRITPSVRSMISLYVAYASYSSIMVNSGLWRVLTPSLRKLRLIS
ncbi:hypothetical protein D3C72_1544270 [compost metagenome]